MAKSKPSKKKKDKKKAAAKQAKADSKRMAKAKHAKADGKVKAKAAAGKAAAGKAAEAGPAKGRLEPKAKGAEHEKGTAAGPAVGPNGKPVKAKAKAKVRKSSRRLTLLRRGPDGEILAPGDLLLPGGTQRVEEIQYLFRGWAAAEHASVGEDAIAEVFVRRPQGEFPSEREELQRALAWAHDRFERGSIEPVIPPRTNLRRSFQGVVERARHRRREIGAFLRGLDLGHTETSHMDAHGEASLQSLMEWAARLENLAEADEPTQADYNQFHRGLDQLESTTEALIIDVEQTLRRLRDRIRG
jgi:hypothetical protein